MSVKIDMELYIGIMSGTSLDGVDAVLAAISHKKFSLQIKAKVTHALTHDLRAQLLKLQNSSDNEIHNLAIAGNALAKIYANCVTDLLKLANLTAKDIKAIGAHGQTIRHQPAKHDGIGYSIQVLAPALLAKLTGIDVIADFRNSDIVAGGQGAPLASKFHVKQFCDQINNKTHVICNIGGIANLTIVPPFISKKQKILGFDCGPGNILLDHLAKIHLGADYDHNGEWAANGTLNSELLQLMLCEKFIKQNPPKSTGRELFNLKWLESQLLKFSVFSIQNDANKIGEQRTKITTDKRITAQDLQTTLSNYTVACIANAIKLYGCSANMIDKISDFEDDGVVIVCGGGAYNKYLMLLLARYLPKWKISKSDDFDIAAKDVEAAAFAKLAYCFTHRLPGNICSVTGAISPSVLGALYPKYVG